MRRLTGWFRRRGERRRTLELPARGRAVIVSDLHGHFGDYLAVLAASRVLERLAAGEDLYLLLTGDVPDVLRHRAVDPAVPPDGDLQILDHLLAARAELGERGRRIVYVEGNHDFHVARICCEVARFLAAQGEAGGEPDEDAPPPVDPGAYADYCAYYRDAYGETVFAANLAPYDMVPRARAEHLRFLKEGPILAVLGASGVLVAHAGPPRIATWPRGEGKLKSAIAGASREALRDVTPREYYESPYHQLLNNRFRNGDYDQEDLARFLEEYGAQVLVTGHTPLPYLLDFERRAPLEGCAFRHGVGLIADRQVVLASSFGAFTPAWKRYLEVDLARPTTDLHTLLAEAARPVYDAQACADQDARPLPGAELVTLEG